MEITKCNEIKFTLAISKVLSQGEQLMVKICCIETGWNVILYEQTVEREQSYKKQCDIMI